MKQELTAADRYRQRSQSNEAEIVDVTVPSGFIFKFQRPSKFSMLFDMGNLPVTAVSSALQSWKADGIGEVDEVEGKQNELKLAEMMFKARDRVLSLSVDPKIVMGVADESKGEISTDHIADTDMAFLFNWVLSGGDAGAMLGTFPAGSQSGSMAQPNRKTRRAKAKRSSGN